jgi:hypothetical protein
MNDFCETNVPKALWKIFFLEIAIIWTMGST